MREIADNFVYRTMALIGLGAFFIYCAMNILRAFALGAIV